MASKLLTLLVPLLFSNGMMVLSQQFSDSNWYWMGGDYLTNQKGIYATVPYWPFAPNPGARTRSAYWTDKAGNLWLFGGWGYDGSGQVGSLSDLWKYSYSGRWTWVKGHKSISLSAVHGIKGVPDINNDPGGRYGSVAWVDNDGNLWLFGGRRSGGPVFIDDLLSDLWKYDIATNEWTWIKGDSAVNQPGTYGAMGIPSDANQPGARESATAWKDPQGNLWLFGGLALGANGGYAVFINDLWKYDIASSQWTWMKGSNQQAYIQGVYGVKGIEDPANTPGPRLGSTGWADNGYLWLWGGNGMSEWSGGLLNDLWKYNTSTGNWTWVHGSKTNNQPSYGAKGIASDLNSPAGRQFPFSWKDNHGNFWLYGGLTTSGYQPSGNPSDLWKYQPSTNQWTWMKGDTILGLSGLYNVGGVPGFIGRPGGRAEGASWITPEGGLWLFGGSDFSRGMLNDLWVINSSFTIVPVRLTYFSASMQKCTVTLRWKTEDETDFDHFILQRSRDGYSFEEIATIQNNKQRAGSNYYYFDENVCRLSSTKLFYRLQMVDRDQKTSLSHIATVTLFESVNKLVVISNPAKDKLKLCIDQDEKTVVQILITNMAGSHVKQIQAGLQKGKNTIDIDVQSFAAGVYNVSVQGSKQTMDVKFVKL